MEHKKIQRAVVKVGTSTLTHENGKPNLRLMERLTQVLSDLQNAGREAVLVTSGAVAVGMNRMNLGERPQLIRERQAVSAVGQCSLMALYDRFFSGYGRVVGQILLTRDVIDDETRKQNAINTFNELLNRGILPIVNENDSISTEELEGIAFGDNDRLSAIVAALVNADALIILTDTDGLYDSDPRANPKAGLIPFVDRVTEDMVNSAGGIGTKRGTGGMVTKLDAAKYATKHGIGTFIINGRNPNNLYKLFDGENVGTYFAVEPQQN
ncbi:MAG: glutamate 5-kinase [Oscillospiraceae bacterium]|jgi:glutamate 5-kinase|nr:glutamate 5-kinase [Oscillospiraceae bacterium]